MARPPEGPAPYCRAQQRWPRGRCRDHFTRVPGCVERRCRAPRRTGPRRAAPAEAARMTKRGSGTAKDGAEAAKDGIRSKRSVYEEELLRLQAELVKLQEWVRAEGSASWWSSRAATRRARAARSSGSRSTSTRASPGSRRCPRPTERERTQWYFQRYVEHLPAAGEIVLFDRTWYNRAGVEQVMGFCTPERAPPVPAPVPDLRAAARRGRHPAAQVLVLGQRRGAGAPVPPAAGGPDAALEALADGPGVDHAAGRTTPGPRTRCSCTPTSPRRRGTSSRATTSAGRGST